MPLSHAGSLLKLGMPMAWSSLPRLANAALRLKNDTLRFTVRAAALGTVDSPSRRLYDMEVSIVRSLISATNYSSCNYRSYLGAQGVLALALAKGGLDVLAMNHQLCCGHGAGVHAEGFEHGCEP